MDKLRLAVAAALSVVAAFFLVAAFGQPQTPEAPQDRTAAQIDTAVADIPFDFFARDSNLKAGRYELSALGPTQWWIRNLDEPSNATQLFTVPDSAEPVADKNPKLIFIYRDNTNYLVGIRDASGLKRLSGLYGRLATETDLLKEIPLVSK